MDDLARFVVAPPFRCGARVTSQPGGACGRAAAWMLRRGALEAPLFLCDRHSRPMAIAIPADVEFRRVSVTLQVLLCAVKELEACAHAEAIERLERAIRCVGGVVNLHACVSQMGRTAHQAPAGATAGASGDH